MQANQGQLEIPLPTITDDPRWIGRFSREVRKSIAALRDRKIIITGRSAIFPRITKKLQITKSSNDEIFITPGYVNQIYPTIAGTSIYTDPPPVIVITAQSWIWIKCVGTFATPDTYVVTIEKTTSSTAPAASTIIASGFTTCFLLGIVDFASGDITTITNVFSGGDMGVESFGSVNMWWAT